MVLQSIVVHVQHHVMSSICSEIMGTGRASLATVSCPQVEPLDRVGSFLASMTECSSKLQVHISDLLFFCNIYWYVTRTLVGGGLRK